MNKRILAYAVIILSVMYFYSSYASSTVGSYCTKIEREFESEKQLLDNCPSLKKGDAILAISSAAAQLCDLSKPITVFNKVYALCEYRGSPRIKLDN